MGVYRICGSSYVNPSGKLSFTVPVNASDLPYFDSQADEIEYGYYHGYTLFERKGLKAAFPFGFGLSYTTFSYSNLNVESREGRVVATFDLENTGDRAGEEAAQLYIGFANSREERPVKLLRGLRKVFLEPGEKKSVSIEVKKEGFAMYNPDKKRWEVEDMNYTFYVGSSSEEKDLMVESQL